MRFSPVQSAWEMEIEGVKMLLGVWWMEVKSKLFLSDLIFILKAAIRGEVEVLPVINLDPQETVMEEPPPHQVGSHTHQGQNECSEASGSQDS